MLHLIIVYSNIYAGTAGSAIARPSGELSTFTVATYDYEIQSTPCGERKRVTLLV